MSKSTSSDRPVVLVTGSAGALGSEMCRQFLDEGYDVVVSDLREEAAQEIASALDPSQERVCVVAIDVGSTESVDAGIDAIIKRFGRLDVLVNNAGITRDTLLMRMTEEQWDEVINTNLKSAFNLTKAVQKPMLKARKGSIINMSSVVGVKGNAGQSNYAASKAGLIGFTKSIAAELGSRNIRCNAIAPGFIETEMTEVLDQKVVEEWRNAIPLKRGGQPKDVADLTVFLGSDMSAYITGQTINVCGGMLM